MSRISRPILESGQTGWLSGSERPLVIIAWLCKFRKRFARWPGNGRSVATVIRRGPEFASDIRMKSSYSLLSPKD